MGTETCDILSNELLEAIKQDGLELKKIPKREQTADICQIAVNQNPLALKYVSVKLRTLDMCSSAVKRSPQAFKYVPETLRNKRIVKMALTRDYKQLKEILPLQRTPELCLIAIKADTRAIAYVPEKIRPTILQNIDDTSLLARIIESDYQWMRYLPDCATSKAICVDVINHDKDFACWLPEHLKVDIDVLNILKANRMIEVEGKEYSKTDNVFYVYINVSTDSFSYYCEAPFPDFDSFYNFLDGDLKDAELRDFDFNGIDLTAYNTTGAVIHHNVLLKYGLYDHTYISTLYAANLNNNISQYSASNLPLTLNDNDGDTSLQVLDMATHHDNIVFYYISDIHLCHRVLNHFGDMATKEEVFSYIRELARRITDCIDYERKNSLRKETYLLIAGDTSSNFELAESFYTELVETAGNTIIVAISGNHELWDPYIKFHDNIATYCRLFESLDIIYLHNNLLIADEYYEPSIISSEELLSMDGNVLRERLTKSRVSILGGIGFSQFNYECNASNMRYGFSFETVSSEEARTLESNESYSFRTLYNKIKFYAPLSKLIVLTHMKRSDWDDGSPQAGWCYVSGHDHHCYRVVEQPYSIFADNQIGYQDRPISLKQFSLSSAFNIFSYYSDGIHIIDETQYRDYNNGMNISFTSCKKREGRYILLKRENTYMFFFDGLHSARSSLPALYLLNGGLLLKAEHQDIEYYYDNMVKYSNNVARMLKRLNEALQQISNYIRKLGGYGFIHGCIIDIDEPLDGFSYYHLYVNPIDGKVTPYYATSMNYRAVYRDLPSLLNRSNGSESILKILDNYKTLSLKSDALALNYSKNEDLYFDQDGYGFDYGTYLYKPSHIIRSLQYTVEKNVIRRWNDVFLDDSFIETLEKAQDMRQVPQAFFLLGE